MQPLPLKDLTRTILEDVVLENFLNDNCCRLQQIKNNQTIGFGKIDLTAVIYNEYKIIREDSSEIIYKSLDELLEDGWLVA